MTLSEKTQPRERTASKRVKVEKYPQPLPSDNRPQGLPPLQFPNRWVLVWGTGIYMAAILARFGIASGLDTLGYESIGAMIGACVGAVIAISGYLLVSSRVEKLPGQSLAGPHKALELLTGFGLGAVLVSAAVGLIALFGGYDISGLNVSPELLIPLGSGIGAGIIEEILFRGYLLRLLDQWLGTWAAMAITAVAFGYVHFANPGATAWSTIAIMLQAGLLLGAAYLVTRRLWFAFGIHLAWNFLQGALFSYTADGAETVNGVFASQTHGPSWITGGTAGLEGSAISTLVCLVAAVLLVLLARTRGNIRPAPKPLDPNQK